MTWSEPIKLDLSNVARDRIRRKEAYPVRLRKVKSVVIEFEDGATESFQPPEGAGFFRERYTWEQEERTHKVTARLDIFEVFWAERTTP